MTCEQTKQINTNRTCLIDTTSIFGKSFVYKGVY